MLTIIMTKKLSNIYYWIEAIGRVRRKKNESISKRSRIQLSLL